MYKIWRISYLYILRAHVFLSSGGKIEEESMEEGEDCNE